MSLRLRPPSSARERGLAVALAAGICWLGVLLTPHGVGAAPAAPARDACVVGAVGTCVLATSPSPSAGGAAAPGGCVLTALGVCAVTTAAASGSGTAATPGTCTIGLLGVCVSPTSSPPVVVPPPAPPPTLLPANCVLNSQNAIVCTCPDGTVTVGGACPAATPATPRPTGPTPTPGQTAPPTTSPTAGATAAPAPAALSFPSAVGAGDGAGGGGGAAPGPGFAPALLRGPTVTTTRDLGALAGLHLGSLSLWPLVALLDGLLVVLLVRVARRPAPGRTEP